jgi:hypothetical protein
MNTSTSNPKTVQEIRARVKGHEDCANSDAMLAHLCAGCA